MLIRKSHVYKKNSQDGSWSFLWFVFMLDALKLLVLVHIKTSSFCMENQACNPVIQLMSIKVDC